MLRRFTRPLLLAILAGSLALLACDDKRQKNNTEQVAPGIHVDKVDASKCPALGSPEKRLVIEGTDFSIAAPAHFEVFQRETKVAREVVLKQTLEGEGDGTLTMRLIIDSEARASGANDGLKVADASAALPVNKTVGEVDFDGQKLPIRLTDRGIDATQRVFIPGENDTEKVVTLMTGVSAKRDCHAPLTALGTEVLRTLQKTSP